MFKGICGTFAVIFTSVAVEFGLGAWPRKRVCVVFNGHRAYDGTGSVHTTWRRGDGSDQAVTAAAATDIASLSWSV